MKEKLIDKKSKEKYLESNEFKEVYKIPDSKGMYVCKLKNKEITLNDSIHFNNLIHGLKGKELLNKKMIEKVDYCRKMRNLIHINMFSISEFELATEITTALIYTKEIIDEIKKKLK